MPGFGAEMGHIDHCRWIVGLQPHHLTGCERRESLACLQDWQWAEQTECIEIMVECHTARGRSHVAVCPPTCDETEW